MNPIKAVPFFMAVLLFAASQSYSSPEPHELIRKVRFLKNKGTVSAPRLAKSSYSGENVQSFGLFGLPEGITSSIEDTMTTDWSPLRKTLYSRNPQGLLSSIQYLSYEEDWIQTEIETFSYAPNRVYVVTEEVVGDVVGEVLRYDTLKYYPGTIPDTLIQADIENGYTWIGVLKYDSSDSLVQIQIYYRLFEAEEDDEWISLGVIDFTYTSTYQTEVSSVFDSFSEEENGWVTTDSTVYFLNTSGHITSAEWFSAYFGDPLQLDYEETYIYSEGILSGKTTNYSDGGETRISFSSSPVGIISKPGFTRSSKVISASIEGRSLKVHLPLASNVTVSIFRPDGRIAATLVKGKSFAVGTSSIVLPRSLAPGKYICSIQAGNTRASTAFILVK